MAINGLKCGNRSPAWRKIWHDPVKISRSDMSAG